MKQTSACSLIFGALLVLLFAGAGCGPTVTRVDPVAGNSLGPASVYVLQRPTRIEGWNFQRPDLSIASDPPIRDIDLALGRDLCKALLDGATFREPARGGGFARAVGFRVWRSEQSVDVILSFDNDQAIVRSGSYTNQPGVTVLGIAAERGRLLELAKRAFPDWHGPAK